LSQVPGALKRFSVVAALCGAGLLVATGSARLLSGVMTEEARFLDGAARVQGTVVRVERPRSEQRAWPVAVIYRFAELQQSATIDVDVSVAEQLGKGASVELVVRSETPGRPRELRTTELRAQQGSFVVPVIGIVGVVAVLLLARELRRALRREIEPLRTGLLVWLTPDQPLPEAPGSFSFAAHYFRDDVKHAVVAQADGRRKPVRNGEKVLAAVAPKEPTWVRVVDEEVAQRLGWYR
jgi:hypothetical protein